jgi:hypothetical protein
VRRSLDGAGWLRRGRRAFGAGRTLAPMRHLSPRLCRRHGARSPPDASHHARSALHGQDAPVLRARMRSARATARPWPLPCVAGDPSMRSGGAVSKARGWRR